MTNGANAADAAGSKRSSREAETATERRRRTPGSLDRGVHLKLAIPESVRINNAGYALRWVNDQGNRMHDLTVQDDWDCVDDVAPVPVGTAEDGKPILARLCRKRQEYFDADQREKRGVILENERGLLRGAKASDEDNRSDDVSYVPKGNRISTG